MKRIIKWVESIPTWISTAAVAVIWFLVGIDVADHFHKDHKYNGPQGIVTNKLWVDEYWEGSEQLYPQRFCLELNHREEICIPEGFWKNITIGDTYGVQK